MMEEDSWICVDESFSSDENFSDSDRIDSETEAELYSLIHFEGNLSSVSCQSSKTKKDTEPDASLLLPDRMKYVLSTESNKNDGETEFVDNSNNFLQNTTNDCTGIENCDKTVADNTLLKIHEMEEMVHIDQVPSNTVNNSNQLAKTQFSSDRNKRKFDPSHPDYSSPPKKACNNTGSEAILADVVSSRNKVIQTNIYEDEDDDGIVFISSDSETDQSSPSKVRISPRQNMSMPNIKVGENSKDLWFVNQEDMSRSRNSKSRRYHDKVDTTCSNCNVKGHHSRICPMPKSIKCYICGGAHFGTECTNRICGKCYGAGHVSSSCWMFPVRFCELCNMQGHFRKNCPDLWRRYHLTTQPGKIVPDKKVKQNSLVFCCKCGLPGHFGAVCNLKQKWYKNCFPTWPNVLSYDEPYSLPVQISNTSGNKQNIEKKDLVAKRKKKNPNEAQKLTRKERLKRKLLRKQELLHSKVLKEKDFPRTPKKNSAVNPPIPRSPKNNQTINPSISRTPKNNSAINPPISRTPKNKTALNLSSLKKKKKKFCS